MAHTRFSYHRFILPTLFVVCVLISVPQIAKASTLIGELNYLLQNYPDIQSKAALSDAAREDLNAANGLSLPSLDLSGDTGGERTDNPGNTDFRAQGSLTGTYNLFDGNLSVFEQQTAQVLFQSSLADLDTTRQLLLFQGIQAYLNLVLQNKLVEISRTNVQLVEQIKTFIETERDLGRMSQADLLQARGRVSQAIEALTAYQGSQRQGQNRYYTLFQRVPEQTKMQDPLVPGEIVPESLKASLEMARRHSPILESAELVAKAANSRIGAAEAGLFPKIDLEAKGDAKYNVDGVDGSEQEGTVLLKLNWNLFDGGQTRSRTKAAALRHNAALMDLRQKHRDVEEQVRNAYTIIETERRRFRTLQEAESIAAEAFSARYDLMQTGEETIINVLDTALELINVRIAVTTTDYSHRLANFQLLLATGQMQQDNLSQLVISGALQPALRDDDQLIQRLASGDGLPGASDPDSPRDFSMTPPASQEAPMNNTLAPMELATTSTANDYDDEGAFRASFETTFGAPYTDELAPEPAPGQAQTQALSGGYYVVLGSFREQRYAQDRITLAGITGAFIQPIELGGTVYQRVLVGPFSKSDAQSTQASARNQGIGDSWVLRQ